MAYRRYVIAVLLFVAVAGIAIGTLQIADASKNDAAQLGALEENESINQEVGLWQYANRALADRTAGFNETVRAFNSSGDELVRGQDYKWNSTDGSITYLSSPNVTDGATGTVTYAYFYNTREVDILSRVIEPVLALVGWSPLLVGGLALGVILLAVTAIVMRYLGDSGPQTRR